jgi:hypothetical protein
MKANVLINSVCVGVGAGITLGITFAQPLQRVKVGLMKRSASVRFKTRKYSEERNETFVLEPKLKG